MDNQAATNIQEPASSNRRIAKNTIMLYIRMFISMVVGLYTSRVVLATLGVEDYGIYGVVGGVVSMLGFLNASMSGATSRFLTFELGRGNSDRLAKTFSSALIVHIAIALIVFVLAETVGLWFLCCKLNIPEARMEAAHWVYQLSILSAMIGITQVPYNACIIAHEKMDVYAYMEILNVSLKLLIVYLLCIGDFDKLKLYAVLTFAVGVLIMMIYRIYSLRHFPEAHFHWLWDKSLLRQLLSYSGWNLYQQFCVTTKQQGTNMLINVFYGVVYNAASSIATTVFGILQTISSNLMLAFTSPIIKSYSTNEKAKVNELVNNCIQYSLILFSFIAVPLCIEMYNVLSLWLEIVPSCADIFCILMIIGQFFGIVSNAIYTLITATGKIKSISTKVGTLYLLVLPISFLLFKIRSASPQIPYIVGIFLNIFILAVYTVCLKMQVNYFSVRTIFKNVTKILIVTAISSIPAVYIHNTFDNSSVRMLLVFLSYFFIYFLLVIFVIIDKSTRYLFIDYTKRIARTILSKK